MYPDHGESFLGDSLIYSFEVSAREFDENEIQDEIDLNFYDEYLTFSLDCNEVQTNDIRLKRQTDGKFQKLDTSKFTSQGDYYFWWKPPYIEYEGYVKASDSFWKVRGVPTVFQNEKYFIYNEKMELFRMTKEISKNDQFFLFKDSPDWEPSNKLNELKISANQLFLTVWFPFTE